MSGLLSRGAVLTASRLSNFAILMLGPLLLVRILDVDAFGQYQEFMIYAMLFITICGFGMDSSLTYFLPRYPNLERTVARLLRHFPFAGSSTESLMPDPNPDSRDPTLLFALPAAGSESPAKVVTAAKGYPR